VDAKPQAYGPYAARGLGRVNGAKVQSGVNAQKAWSTTQIPPNLQLRWPFFISHSLPTCRIDIGRGEYRQLNIKTELEKYSSRARPFVGDQTDEALLNRIGTEAVKKHGGFDLVIDDGGHSMEQQQTSLKVLSSYMKPHGIYAIEDIETSYYEQYGGGEVGKPGTTIDLMKGLIDVVNRDYIEGHYKALDRPRRNVGTHSIFKNDHKISSVRIFPTCAVLYFGYNENLPAEFRAAKCAWFRLVFIRQGELLDLLA
jgi:hypothetical protein